MIPIIKPGINTISAYYGDSSYQYSSNGHDVFPVYFEDYNNVTLTDIISGGTQSTVPSSRAFSNMVIDDNGDMFIEGKNNNKIDPSTICSSSTTVAKNRRVINISSSNQSIVNGKLRSTDDYRNQATITISAPINKHFSMINKVNYITSKSGAYMGFGNFINGAGFARNTLMMLTGTHTQFSRQVHGTKALVV